MKRINILKNKSKPDATEARLDRIRKLVGHVTREQLRYVDSFIGEDVALFMPGRRVLLYLGGRKYEQDRDI